MNINVAVVVDATCSFAATIVVVIVTAVDFKGVLLLEVNHHSPVTFYFLLVFLHTVDFKGFLVV